MASASLISGVDLPVVLLRLYLLPILLISVALLAIAGWRVSGRPYVGVVAAALVFAIGELKLIPGVASGFGSVFTFTAWASPSMSYSYLFFFPLIHLLADRFTRQPGGRSGWSLIGLFVLASTGGKSSSIAVLLGGVALVCGVELLRRRIYWPAVAAGAVLVAGQLFASIVLLHGAAYGTTIGPLHLITSLPFAEAALASERPAWQDALIAGGAVVVWAVVLLARLAGIPALLRRSPGPVELFLLGGFAAGLCAALLLDHPGGSEAYFLKTAWPLGALASAWGFVELVERRPVPRWLGWALGGGLTATTAVLVLLAPRLWPPVRATGAASVLAAARPLLALAAAALLATASWWVARAVRPQLRGAGPVVAVASVLAAGAANLPIEAQPAVEGVFSGRLPAASPIGVSPSMASAARWLRDHSGPDDIVATNAHCVDRSATGLVGGACNSLAFWVTGFAERRALVESWGYTTLAHDTQPPPGLRFTEQPFPDQALLRTNDAAFTDPTREGLAALRDRHHVRWLIADRRAGASPKLADLATLRFRGADAEVYELTGD
jgi:hypothetical protein